MEKESQVLSVIFSLSVLRRISAMLFFGFSLMTLLKIVCRNQCLGNCVLIFSGSFFCDFISVVF